MSKYKVGDRFNISGKIVDVGDGVYRIQAGAFDILCYDSAIVSDSMTAEEAWDIAKKLFADFSDAELDEIFGKGWSYPKLMDLTPHEAKEKIKAWEAEKAEKEIKVGDVVIETSGAGNEYIGVVTQIIINQYSMCMVYADGSAGIALAKNIKKTGRHIDIDGLLKQIGG